MEKLFQGVVKFRRTDFEQLKPHFQTLGREQSPHTLFIGCSDSRVVPSLITKTLPGELFIVRNIANIIPPYAENDEYYSTRSAIEYAVKVLNVGNILICGHSNCGGCASLFKTEEELKDVPSVRKWLELASPVREKVLALPESADPAEREWLAEQFNIVEQMRHLASYPFIRERYEAGKLNIIGWYYIIETGDVYNYNTKTQLFEPICAAEGAPCCNNGTCVHPSEDAL